MIFGKLSIFPEPRCPGHYFGGRHMRSKATIPLPPSGGMKEPNVQAFGPAVQSLIFRVIKFGKTNEANSLCSPVLVDKGAFSSKGAGYFASFCQDEVAID
jgi:hypothetical protein